MPISTHPAADVWPLMVGAEFDKLVLDIREHGLREPIVLHPDGSLLDGRNRERACARAGVTPRYVTWAGQPGTEMDFVISANDRRRHMSIAERAEAAAKVANLQKGGTGGFHSDPPVGGSPLPAPVTTAKAAEIFGVSKRTIERRRAAERAKEPTPRGPQADMPRVRERIAMQRERAKHWKALSEALAAIGELPDPADIIPAIPPHGGVEILSRRLPVAIRWLCDLQKKWSEHDRSAA